MLKMAEKVFSIDYYTSDKLDCTESLLKMITFVDLAKFKTSKMKNFSVILTF
jgi:hypothetical protein